MTNLTLIHLVFAVLASWRITELFTQDRITEKLRTKFPSYVWQCIRCMSVWSGIFVSLAFLFCPWLNWPFAFAWLYLWHIDAVTAKRIARRGRRLTVDFKKDGTWSVNSELSREEVQSVLVGILSPATTDSK